MEKEFDEMNEQQNQPNSQDTTFGQKETQENTQEQNQYSQNQYGQNQYGQNQYNQGYQNQYYNGHNQFQYQQNFNQQDFNKKPKKKNGSRAVGVVCAIAAFGVVIGLGTFSALRVLDRKNMINNTTLSGNNSITNREPEEDTSGVNSNPIASTETVNGGNENSGVSKVVENALPSIVMITCNVTTSSYGQSGQGVASGSGIIVKEDKKYLYIATNYHVVADANAISVVFKDEKSVNAALKAYDSTNDLAILKIKLSDIKESTKKEIKIATLGSSDDVKVGAMAIAIGNALGYGQSVTVGYVSAKDRAVTIDNSTRVLLQTDAAINPGNSGGALLDVNGKVIGINSAKYSSTEVEGVCYAIPISKAIPILNDLMTKDALAEDEKGYLGVSGTDVDETVHSYYNVPLGVRVTAVENNGAADKAGIKENDIITAVNGIQVTSISALKERVNSYKVGTEVTLTVQRQSNGGYKEMKIKVTLQKGSSTASSNNGRGQSGSQGNKRNDGGNYYYFGGGQGSDGSQGQWPFGMN